MFSKYKMKKLFNSLKKILTWGDSFNIILVICNIRSGFLLTSVKYNIELLNNINTIIKDLCNVLIIKKKNLLFFNNSQKNNTKKYLMNINNNDNLLSKILGYYCCLNNKKSKIDYTYTIRIYKLNNEFYDIFNFVCNKHTNKYENKLLKQSNEIKKISNILGNFKISILITKNIHII